MAVGNVRSLDCTEMGWDLGRGPDATRQCGRKERPMGILM